MSGRTSEKDLVIETTPRRAMFVMRGVVVLDAPVGSEDLAAVWKLIDREGADGKLDAAIKDLGDGNAQLTLGDLATDESSDTHLVVHVDAPGYGTFKCIFGPKRLADLWSNVKSGLRREESPLARFVEAALGYAAGEDGAPVDAFKKWLIAENREGHIRVNERPLAATSLA